jgi:hypothetical protein
MTALAGRTIPSSANGATMTERFSEEFQIFNVRLPIGTIERLHRYRDHLNVTQPGIEATASMAARMLLLRALDQVEEELGIKKPKSRLLRGKK